MNFTIEIEQEVDGRWIAEVMELPGAMSYGANSSEAKSKAPALALMVVAEQLKHEEAEGDLLKRTEGNHGW